MSARNWPVTLVGGVAVGLAALAPLASAQSPAVAATASKQSTDNRPAAVVNGETISLADIELVLKRQPPPAQPLTELHRRQQRLEVLGLLIDDLLIQQFLRAANFKVEPSEVDKELARLDVSLKAQNKTRVDFYRDTTQTEAQLRATILTMVQWNAYLKTIVSDDKLKKYYDDNKDFFDQVQVRCSQVLLRVAADGPAADRQAAKSKLAAIRADIVANKLTFADAVTKYSQCPSAANGGDLGFVTRKFVLHETLAKAAFATPVNEVTDVLESEYGVHLIKVTDRKAGQPTTFEKVKDDVRDFFVEEQRQVVLTQCRQTAKIEVNLP